VRNTVDEATLFGEASFRLAPFLLATAGGRLLHARLSGEALDAPAFAANLLRGLQASRSETALLPSVSLLADPFPNTVFFARYQEGFRPGGLSVSGPIVERYNNDRIRTVEAGFRYGRPGARAFDAALSLAYTHWTDIQADVVDFTGMPTTRNVGEGRIYTLDLRLGWRPLPGLSIEAAAMVNDSVVTNPLPNIIIAPESPLPNVARFNGRMGVSYSTELTNAAELTVFGNARYVGRSTLGIGAVLGDEQGDWLDLGAGARLQIGRHRLSLTGSNLLDTAGNRFALGSPFTILEKRQITPLVPRSIRLSWDVRF
jgi:outer membrane receptor protein involved in Fe transport